MEIIACNAALSGSFPGNDGAVQLCFCVNNLKPLLLKCVSSALFFLLSPFPSPQGKAIGVGIGCILGMFPLLFFKDDDEKKKKEGQTVAKDDTQPPPAPTESSKNWNCQPCRRQILFGIRSNTLNWGRLAGVWWIGVYGSAWGPVNLWKVFWRGF